MTWNRDEQNFWIYHRRNPVLVSSKTGKMVCYFPSRWIYDKDKVKKVCFAKNVNEAMSLFEEWV